MTAENALTALVSDAVAKGAASGISEALGQIAADIAAIKVHVDARAKANHPFLEVDQAATLLSVSRRTILRLIERGLPVIRLGGIVRIQRDDLLKYLSEHRVQSAPSGRGEAIAKGLAKKRQSVHAATVRGSA